MPKVTVIMPSLNVAPYIRTSMESVTRQTLRDIEILCVDAGSTDGTRGILLEYAQRDDRVRLIDSPRKSYGYQINLGVDQAQGEYIGIVETDDYIEPTMYETLYAQAKAEDLDILKADYFVLTESRGRKSRIPCHLSRRKSHYGVIFEPSKDIVYFNDTLYTWAGIYKTEFLRRNHIRHNETPGASFQDNGFWFQTFSLAKRVEFRREALYVLRRDNPDSSVFAKEKVFCECEEYDFIRAFLRGHPELEDKLAPVCAYRRFKSYMSTLKRIAAEYRPAFLERFSRDFRKIRADGELDRAMFSNTEWQVLCWILEDPQARLPALLRNARTECVNSLFLRGLHCAQEHGLVYTAKYMFLGRIKN